jgi:hypothetical protein
VIKAYSSPVVDSSSEEFSFGSIDTDNLAMFLARHLHWGLEDFEEAFNPVLEKQREEAKGKQTSLKDYFSSYQDGKMAGGFRSKRLKGVLERKVGEVAGIEVEEGMGGGEEGGGGGGVKRKKKGGAGKKKQTKAKSKVAKLKPKRQIEVGSSDESSYAEGDD